MLGNKIMKKKNYAITSVCYFKNTNGNKYDGKFSHEKTFQSTEKKKKRENYFGIPLQINKHKT